MKKTKSRKPRAPKTPKEPTVETLSGLLARKIVERIAAGEDERVLAELKAFFPEEEKMLVANTSVAVFQLPPPRGMAKCTRCDGSHPRLTVLRFDKPVQFIGTDGKLAARFSHWATCPKTKAPILFGDRIVTPANAATVRKYFQTKKNLKYEDPKRVKEVLGRLDELDAPPKMTETSAAAQQITVKFTNDVKGVWAYDENAKTESR